MAPAFTLNHDLHNERLAAAPFPTPEGAGSARAGFRDGEVEIGQRARNPNVARARQRGRLRLLALSPTIGMCVLRLHFC
jgi:hypothetical protein